MSAIVGENGILNRATDASKKTNDASGKEKTDFDKMTELIDETVSGIKTVNQVMDEHPGELETNGSEKIINSIEDLVFFAYDVKNGNSYESQTVKLGLSLDFNSAKSYVNAYRTDYGKYGYNGELKNLLNSSEGFKPIDKNFKGIFDGNYFKLYNLFICENIDKKENYVPLGMFNENNGTIKNLGLEGLNYNCIIYAKYPCLGGIAGLNNGNINNCYAKGNIYCELSGTSISVGELVGNNKGKIENSFVEINLNFDGKSFIDESCSLRIGGIAGIQENVSGVIIKNTYNKENITLINTEDILNNCTIYCGGICGWNLSTILNSYSLAKLKINYCTAITYISGAIGREQDNDTDKNNFYLENNLEYFDGDHIAKDFPDSSTKKSFSDMKTSDFVSLLNDGQKIWIEDINNINNGYPILNWQN